MFNGTSNVLQPAVHAYKYNDGGRYADFSPGLDTVATFGVGALVYKTLTGSGKKATGAAAAGLIGIALLLLKKIWFLALLPFVFFLELGSTIASIEKVGFVNVERWWPMVVFGSQPAVEPDVQHRRNGLVRATRQRQKTPHVRLRRHCRESRPPRRVQVSIRISAISLEVANVGCCLRCVTGHQQITYIELRRSSRQIAAYARKKPQGTHYARCSPVGKRERAS